jgi:hypothetical protein
MLGAGKNVCWLHPRRCLLQASDVSDGGEGHFTTVLSFTLEDPCHRSAPPDLGEEAHCMTLKCRMTTVSVSCCCCCCLLLLVLLLVEDRTKRLFQDTIDSTVHGDDKAEQCWSHHDCNSLKKAKVWRIKIISLVAERRRLTDDDDDYTTSGDVTRWDGAKKSNNEKTSDEDDATCVGVCLKDIAFFEEEIAADSLQLLRKKPRPFQFFSHLECLQQCFL